MKRIVITPKENFNIVEVTRKIAEVKVLYTSSVLNYATAATESPLDELREKYPFTHFEIEGVWY